MQRSYIIQYVNCASQFWQRHCALIDVDSLTVVGSYKSISIYAVHFKLSSFHVHSSCNSSRSQITLYLTCPSSLAHTRLPEPPNHPYDAVRSARHGTESRRSSFK